ncbi:hypothetical protein BCR44DRAFT_1260812 [Catenaria anguillulae PL171]|uniref:Uncharacterized protein n=1 Tax=Catenaria anguillulae PL171 TaxID=765915 RepID=A0A1Y2HB42_9FUNG|nr:hypothetical protein BCR44DRAFT_1260812 [Catenaria anguillulae PL171]
MSPCPCLWNCTSRDENICMTIKLLSRSFQCNMISRLGADIALLLLFGINVFLLVYCTRNLVKRIRRNALQLQSSSGGGTCPEPNRSNNSTPPFLSVTRRWWSCRWLRTCEFVQLVAVLSHLITLALRIASRHLVGLSSAQCAQLILVSGALGPIFRPCSTGVLIYRCTSVLPKHIMGNLGSRMCMSRVSRISPRRLMRWTLSVLYAVGTVFWALAGLDQTRAPREQQQSSALAGDGTCTTSVEQSFWGPGPILHLLVYILVAFSFVIPLGRHLVHIQSLSPTAVASSPTAASSPAQPASPSSTQHTSLPRRKFSAAAAFTQSRSVTATHKQIVQLFWMGLLRTLGAVFVYLTMVILDLTGAFGADANEQLVKYSIINASALAAASFAAPKRGVKVVRGGGGGVSPQTSLGGRAAGSLQRQNGVLGNVGMEKSLCDSKRG